MPQLKIPIYEDKKTAVMQTMLQNGGQISMSEIKNPN